MLLENIRFFTLLCVFAYLVYIKKEELPTIRVNVHHRNCEVLVKVQFSLQCLKSPAKSSLFLQYSERGEVR